MSETELSNDHSVSFLICESETLLPKPQMADSHLSHLMTQPIAALDNRSLWSLLQYLAVT